jgi:hypothetical protein
MWGSLVMNFVGIGAAGLIESHGMAPRPASADPVFPGVVIRHAIPGMDVDGWTPPSGVLIPIMWVGDSNNARRSIVDPKSGNVVTVLDGPGICMFLFRASAAGLGGPWESSGGLRDPHGYFCARRHAD